MAPPTLHRLALIGGLVILAASLTSWSQTSTFTLHLDSGGGGYIAHGGKVWIADSFFIGGSAISTTTPIFNTTDSTVYRSARTGNFSYVISNVPNGNYSLNLKFAELNWASPGSRVFNVSANGQPLLTNFDIVRDVGAGFNADDKSFIVAVSDNTLTMSFTSVTGGALVNGIEITPSDIAPLSPPVTNPPVVSPPPTSTTSVQSCGEITKSGAYALTGNLTAAPGTTCLNIHDTSNVQVDCKQFSITTDTTSDPSLSTSAVKVTNVTGYSISNCNLTALNPTPSAFLQVLAIGNSPQGTVASNNITGGYMSVSNSSRLEIRGNTVTGDLEISGSDFVTIENNTFNLNPYKIYPATIVINSSNGAVIQSNQLNGGWDGIDRPLQTAIGADDGIAFINVSGLTIQNNTILNNWDCGLEGSGDVTNTEILNNQITTAGICGIGAWYASSWRGTNVSGNTVQNAYYLFDFYRLLGLGGGEQFVYFQNNTFSSNKLVSQRTSAGNVIASSYIDLQDVPSDISAGSVILGNNLFSGNDFNVRAGAPYFLPTSMIVDGGGNVCGSQNQQANFPLHCGGSSSSNVSAQVICPDPGVGAFTACYFGNTNLTGNPVIARTEGQVNWDWSGGLPSPSLQLGNFSARWAGNFSLTGGNYVFTATTSDGMRLYVDGQVVLDRWRDQAASTYSIKQSLVAGKHLITVEYYDHNRSGTARVSWQQVQ